MHPEVVLRFRNTVHFSNFRQMVWLRQFVDKSVVTLLVFSSCEKYSL